MKKENIYKLILAVVGVIIVIFLIYRCFFQGEKQTEEDYGMQQGTINHDDTITYGQMIRLYSMLFYSKAQRDALTYIVDYSDVKSTQELSSYINAAIIAGIIKNAEQDVDKLSPESSATCGQFRDILWATVDNLGLDYTIIKELLPERLQTVTERDVILYGEVVEVFEALVSLLEEKKEEGFSSLITIKELYFVGQNTSDLEAGTVLVQDGKHYILDQTLITN